MQRLLKHLHAARMFETDQLRLPNGDYTADAPAKLHEWWLNRGLNIEFEQTPMASLLRVSRMCCVEDLS